LKRIIVNSAPITPSPMHGTCLSGKIDEIFFVYGHVVIDVVEDGRDFIVFTACGGNGLL
jgi:hypothetical protein